MIDIKKLVDEINRKFPETMRILRESELKDAEMKLQELEETAQRNVGSDIGYAFYGVGHNNMRIKYNKTKSEYTYFLNNVEVDRSKINGYTYFLNNVEVDRSKINGVIS